ncbi:MAG TPA: hypothetical protein VIF09_12860, partial [Polyangiaceae bacterium]
MSRSVLRHWSLFALPLLAGCSGSPTERSSASSSPVTVENVGWDATYTPLGGPVGNPNGLSAIIDGVGAAGVAEIASDNSIQVNFETHALDDVWKESPMTGWRSLGGYGTSAPTMVLDASRRINLFVRGGEGYLWVKSEVFPGDHMQDGWPFSSSWISLGNPRTGLISTTARNAVALDGSGHLNVFALTAQGELYVTTQKSQSPGNFGPWYDLNVALTGSPAAATDASGVVHVYGRGQGGDLIEVREVPGSPGYYTAPWSLGGPQSGTINAGVPDVGVAAWNNAASKGLEIFVVAPDGQLCSMIEGALPWTCYGGYLTEPPTAVSWNGKTSVFTRGGEMAVWEIDSNDTPAGGKGQWFTLGGSAAGAPVVAVAQRAVYGQTQQFPHLFVEGAGAPLVYARNWMMTAAPSSAIPPTTYRFSLGGVEVVSAVELPAPPYYSPDQGYVERVALATQVNAAPPISQACSLGPAAPGKPPLTTCTAGSGSNPFIGPGPINVPATVTYPSDNVKLAVSLNNIESFPPSVVNDSLPGDLASAGDTVQGAGAVLGVIGLANPAFAAAGAVVA